jgi:hypothetical protein
MSLIILSTHLVAEADKEPIKLEDRKSKRNDATLIRPDGEIGRRARLRIWYRKVCGFESLSGHLLPVPQMTRTDQRIGSAS